VGSRGLLIVPLSEAAHYDETAIGGKALSLGRLIDAGYRVPPGFCIAASAYEQFLDKARLAGMIRMELGRKPLAEMRWEEIWDTALRIRSAFLSAEVPGALSAAISSAYRDLGGPVVAVRSSAPGEDSAQRSYAGLHESLVGVEGEAALLDAVRIVWASLWSDAALLYRRELGMDPQRSRMAVVVQAFEKAAPSGVGFGIDPREPENERQIVEAVPGLCEDLVTGNVDPDRWIMKRSTGDLVEWRPGQRGEPNPKPLLGRPDLAMLHKTLRSVEELFGWPPDIEWTGSSAGLTLLQARPVTHGVERENDDRAWYLTLRPGRGRLAALCARVTEELIPALEAEASQLADEALKPLCDGDLADAIGRRSQTLRKREKIYRDDFIPFAHGVRQLGLYYNDAVKPEDPYEFIGLLRNQPMFAVERNQALAQLAVTVRQHPDLRRSLERLTASDVARDRGRWPQPTDDLVAEIGFFHEFDAFLDRFMGIAYKGEALDERPDLALRIVLELAGADTRPDAEERAAPDDLEDRLMAAVGPKRAEEARDIIRVGRLSWRLRDDDNILMGRLEKQLRRALDLGASRLRSRGRLAADVRVPAAAAEQIAAALRDPSGGELCVPQERQAVPASERPGGETPRQLIGQPAAPGMATGRARIVRGPRDIGDFERGEILVCDAIQPTMTHLVPIAGAIVERRGGMLIHGAIIARELGVPCVNGVRGATDAIADGELLTVDGNLGIVTVGPPEFDLEHGSS